MKDKTKGLIIGLVIGAAFAGTTVYADYSMKITSTFKEMNIFVDGIRKSTQEVIIYNGVTYAPIRALSTALDKPLNADFTRSDLYIGKAPAIKGITSDQAIQLVKKQYKVPSSYKINLDHLDEDGNYVIQVFEIVIDNTKTGEGHTATFGWYTVDKYSGKIKSMF
ncbi:putative TIM-barrel enzyme [Paenibacillus castaneae]|uniref:hypothetical protein n=1 Tax=Paenibacillus castaneae TaxID=474957 RepID=UPI000C9A41F3|nr:hypothetical protein [Paenibacillus castaneae]NIK75298.1 putative TIM-barrel enzyme [Paenibacillus castaneae]